MRVPKTTFLLFAFTLLAMLTLVSCSEWMDDIKEDIAEDYEDEYEDEIGDDDDGGGGDEDAALNDCILWYMECGGVSEQSAQDSCEWIDLYNEGEECVQEALDGFFACLAAEVDCQDWENAEKGIDACLDEFDTVFITCR